MSHEGLEQRWLKIGSVPPDFVFDADDVSVRLSELRWRHRVLLILCPGGFGGSCMQEAQTIRDAWADFDERDVVAIMVAAVDADELQRFGEQERIPFVLLSDPQNQVIKDYGLEKSDHPITLLIGKDGFIRSFWSGFPPNRELFQLIDAMPLRRHEMRRAA